MRLLRTRVLQACIKALHIEEIINYSQAHSLSLVDTLKAIAKAKAVVCKRGFLTILEDVPSDSSKTAQNGLTNDTNTENQDGTSETGKEPIIEPIDPLTGEKIPTEPSTKNVDSLKNGFLDGELKDFVEDSKNKTLKILNTIDEEALEVTDSSKKGNRRYCNRQYAIAKKRIKEMEETAPCKYSVVMTNIDQPVDGDRNEVNRRFYKQVNAGLRYLKDKKGIQCLEMWEAHLNGYLHCHIILFCENWLSIDEETAEDGAEAGETIKNLLQFRFGGFAHCEVRLAKSEKAENYALKTYKYYAEKVCRELKEQNRTFTDEERECIGGELITSRLGLRQMQFKRKQEGRAVGVHNAPTKKDITPDETNKKPSLEEILANYEQGLLTDEEFIPYIPALLEKYFPCATRCLEVIVRTDCTPDKTEKKENEGTIEYMKRLAGLETYGNNCKACPIMDMYKIAMEKIRSPP